MAFLNHLVFFYKSTTHSFQQADQQTETPCRLLIFSTGQSEPPPGPHMSYSTGHSTVIQHFTHFYHGDGRDFAHLKVSKVGKL